MLKSTKLEYAAVELQSYSAPTLCYFFSRADPCTKSVSDLLSFYGPQMYFNLVLGYVWPFVPVWSRPFELTGLP